MVDLVEAENKVRSMIKKNNNKNAMKMCIKMGRMATILIQTYYNGENTADDKKKTLNKFSTFLPSFFLSA